MEFTIKEQAKDSLIQFVDWIKIRAEEKVHKNNKDLIADFLEHFIVVELKRMENEKETREIKVEIPDDQIPNQGPDPIDLIRKVVKTMTSEMVDEKGNPIKIKDILSGQVAEETPDFIDGVKAFLKAGNKVKAVKLYKEYKGESLIQCKEAVDRIQKQMNAPPPEVNAPPPKANALPIKRSRSGNNHSVGKKRRLTNDERDYITSQFTTFDGNLDENACSRIADVLKLSVNGKTPWQVTGYVSELHRKVAAGTLSLPNPSVYKPPKQSGSITPSFVPKPRKQT